MNKDFLEEKIRAESKGVFTKITSEAAQKTRKGPMKT